MIDSTSNNAQALLDEASYGAFNALLDAAETNLLGLAVAHQLHGISVERWRWDQAEIVMSWSPVRGTLLDLGKNIRVYASVSDPARIECAVESNAWIDEHLPDASIVRHWENFSDRPRNIADPRDLTKLESQWLKQQIERAYERIADERAFVLSHAVRIFPDGRSEPVDAPVRISDDAVSDKTQARKL